MTSNITIYKNDAEVKRFGIIIVLCIFVNILKQLSDF